MGKRLQAEFTTLHGSHDYRIEIHDTDFSGTPVDFTVTGDGFSKSYSGDTNERTASIFGSEIEFSFPIQTTQQVAFESALIGAKEGRFTVQIFQNDVLDWVGEILVDIITIRDEPLNPGRILTLRAVDGLGRLKDWEYKDVTGPYSGKITLLEHVYTVLNRLQILGTLNTECLKTSIGWRENTAATGDPLTTTRVDHKAFIKVDEQGEFTYSKCADILKYILRLFQARIFQSAGSYWIVQAGQYVANNMTVYAYNSAGALVNTYTGQTYKQVDLPAGSLGAEMHRYAGGQFTYFAPLRYAAVNYKHFTAANLSVQRVLFDTQTYNIADIPSGGATSVLYFACQVQTKLSTTVPGTIPPVFVKYGLLIQIGSYYYSRPATVLPGSIINYEGGIWTTTPSEYEFFTPAIDLEDVFINQAVNFTTAPIVSSGNMSIRIAFQVYVDLNGNPVTSTWTREANFTRVYMEIITAGVISNRVQETEYRADNSDTQNTVTLEIDTPIGDGPYPTTLGRLDVYDGTAWEPSDLWSGLGQTTPKPLLQLLANELLAGQAKPTQKITSEWRGAGYLPHMAIDYGGVNYLPLDCTQNAYRETWGGTFFAVTRQIGQAVDAGIKKKLPRPDVVKDEITTDDNRPNPATVVEAIARTISVVYTSGTIAKGATVTSLPIVPAGNDNTFVPGDRIILINNINGQIQDFAVSGTVNTGATSIDVTSETAAFEIFPGSVIIADPGQNQKKINAPGFRAYQQETVSPGSNVITWTQNGGVFPPNTKAQLWVMLAGQKQVEGINYTLSGSNITIDANLIWAETVVEVIANY